MYDNYVSSNESSIALDVLDMPELMEFILLNSLVHGILNHMLADAQYRTHPHGSCEVQLCSHQKHNAVGLQQGHQEQPALEVLCQFPSVLLV